MKRMSKSVRQEVAWLLPTQKRLKFIEKKAIERLADVCYINNECCEMMAIEKERAEGYNATNIIAISDNLSYVIKYIESLSRMHAEIADSCKEMKEVLNGNQNKYVCPLLLRGRFKKMLYVSDLLANAISEMCNIHKELSKEFGGLLKDKILNTIRGLSDSERYEFELGIDF